MKTQNILLAGLTVIGAALLPLVAQANPYHGHGYQYSLNQRFRNENYRINQGLRDHQLNLREAQGDRYRLARVRYQDDSDLYRQDGRLSFRERRQLNGELRRNSGDIYRMRHNGN